MFAVVYSLSKITELYPIFYFTLSDIMVLTDLYEGGSTPRFGLTPFQGSLKNLLLDEIFIILYVNI